MLERSEASSWLVLRLFASLKSDKKKPCNLGERVDRIRHTVIVEWDPEEKLYIATMPALSIGSYGPTRQEAIDNSSEAAEVTIEGLRETGQPVPQCF